LKKSWTILFFTTQVVLFVSQMFWTSEVHEALRSNGLQGLKDYVNVLNTQVKLITI